ncbi:hypothetical protein [Lysobacter sp. D1-1-M9]|uniref:hypothetical protein n=1 Tax=Novilysobacter longmucuonensis TaxID=3098603 RepID=UPI002FCB441A
MISKRTTGKLKSACVALAMMMMALFVGPAAAQDFSIGWNPRSGDVWVDSYLEDVNRYGARYRSPFIDEMVRYYGAPRDLVTALLAERGWAPGDVYYACAIAQIVGRPCRYVVERWERDHAQGWGAVAQELGIKPGSPEFHRLKRGFVGTYDRWARPIEIDSDLRADFPQRGQGPDGTWLDRDDRGAPAGRGPAGGNGNGKPAHAAGAQPGRGDGPGQGDAGRGRGNNGKGKSKGRD